MLGPREQAVLKTITEDQAYENYFFNRVSDIKWFDELSKKGYFLPDKIPLSRQADQEGHYLIPHWIVLNYLERISLQINEGKNIEYAIGLLDIINDVTKYHVEHSKKIDNYSVWWYFVKILINVPNDIIVKYLKSKNILIGKDWLKEWLVSKFDSSLSSSDVATKLLPKFLTNNKEELSIAEQIVDVITEIKDEFFEDGPVRKLGSFEKIKDPKTQIDPYWLLEAFKKYGDKIGTLCDKSIIYNIANKLKMIFHKEHENHQVFLEIGGNHYRINARYIKDFSYEIVVEVLDRQELAALKPEEQYFGVLKVKGSKIDSFTIDDIKAKSTFVDAAIRNVIKNDNLKCLAAYKDINRKIENLYDGLFSDYSSIWFESLESSPDVGIYEAKELLAYILRDLLRSKCKLDIDTGKDILNNFLSENYQYSLFKRFVLYITNRMWADYNQLFWNFIDNISDAFDNSNYEPELYNILQINVSQFNKEEKEKIKGLIKKGPRWLPDEKQEHYIAYWKQKWYSALTKDKDFTDLYEKERIITKIDKIKSPTEKRSFVGWSGPGPSPLSKEDMFRMDNVELTKYINDFKETDRWEGPTEDGLAEKLKLVVKENPVKFVNNMSPFLHLRYKYVYHILYGFEDAWKEKKPFEWNKVFNFAKEYLAKEHFIEECKKGQGEDWHPYHVWIINVLSDLIQEGSRDDAWAFGEEYFHYAQDIIDTCIKLLAALPKKDKPTHNDALSEALNTSYGRLTMAIILLSLRIARVNDKKEGQNKHKWDPIRYESLLKNDIIEAYTHFGRYMPNLIYLNKEWVIDKIKDLEDMSTDDIRWQSFMAGYLFGYSVYEELYKLMRNHYIKAINSDFVGDKTEDRLADHIAIGYLRGVEAIDDDNSLFKKIIDKWSNVKIRSIIGFFWSQSRNIVERIEKKKDKENDHEMKQRIIQFWKWIYNHKDLAKEKLQDKYLLLLSDISKLVVILDKIDQENAAWLCLSAPYVEKHFNASFFLEYLDKLTNKESIEFVSKIILEMISKSLIWHPEERIVSITRKIYQFGKKEDADEICNRYVKAGYIFLKSVYNEFNAR